MKGKVSYECKKCGALFNRDDDSEVPVCCGIRAERLPECTSTDTAEHARANDNGEPCNDGRAG
ncbi:MAG: hypothetical protein JXN64_01450 [Spirochaetes bacterium]|nr:hypothetical protein [Spirochaetota bacterium]